MIPAQVMAESREKSELTLDESKPYYGFMVILIVAMWIVVFLAAGFLLHELWKK
jgi:hypothetical protein